MELPPFGRQIKTISFAPVQQLGAQQALQLIQTARPLAIPHLTATGLAPVPIAEERFIGAPIAGQGMTDGHQQRQQLDGPTIFQRCSGEEPNRADAGMAGQTQQRLAANGVDVLGEMGLIHNQDNAARWWFSRNPGPADQAG